ncbi:MAG: signal peptidase I [Clostridiales bacterium]|nr:signal peptidase I [Clostridiales bacterium]
MAIRIYKVIQAMLLVMTVSLIMGLGFLIVILDINPYVIISGSMEPELPVGSVCLVDCQQKEPEAGDIISYKAKDTIITHRVIEKTDGGYITKGDSNSVADPGIVKPKQIFGTVICSIPQVGYAVMFMRTLKGIVLIAIGAVCFGLIGRLLERK